MPNLFKAIVVSALSVIGIRTEQQPAYTVKERVGEIEIRQYTPRVAAETTVDAADDSAARSEGFNILAGYILFGSECSDQETNDHSDAELPSERRVPVGT